MNMLYSTLPPGPFKFPKFESKEMSERKKKKNNNNDNNNLHLPLDPHIYVPPGPRNFPKFKLKKHDLLKRYYQRRD